MLYDAIEEVAPKLWDEETQITLDRDLMYKKHRDRGNKERSWILWLGDFVARALNFDDGTQIEGKREWRKINRQTHHWNDPHAGSMYSIVLCKGYDEAKTQNDSIRSLGKTRARKKAAHVNSCNIFGQLSSTAPPAKMQPALAT